MRTSKTLIKRVAKISCNKVRFFLYPFFQCVYDMMLQTNQKLIFCCIVICFQTENSCCQSKARGKKSRKLKLIRSLPRKELLNPEVFSAWEWTMRLDNEGLGETKLTVSVVLVIKSLLSVDCVISQVLWKWLVIIAVQCNGKSTRAKLYSNVAFS